MKYANLLFSRLLLCMIIMIGLTLPTFGQEDEDEDDMTLTKEQQAILQVDYDIMFFTVNESTSSDANGLQITQPQSEQQVTAIPQVLSFFENKAIRPLSLSTEQENNPVVLASINEETFIRAAQVQVI